MNMRGYTSSLVAKLSLILCAMGAIILVAIWIATTVFHQTIVKLEALNSQRLPELASVSALATASTELSTGLVSLVTAETQSEMQQNRLQVESAWTRLSNANDALGDGSQGDLSTFIADLEVDLATLAESRARNFESRAKLAQRLDELRQMTSVVSEEFKQEAEQAVRDVEGGGAQTTSDVERTLGRLISVDLKTLETVYGMQASANLAVGISIALTNTIDPVLADIFREINTEALQRLKTLNDELVASSAEVEFNQKRFTGALEALEKVNNSPPSVAKTQRRFVMKARATLDSLFTRASGELTSILTKSSQTTSADNAAAIQGLLDGPVQNLKNVSALNLAVANFFGIAMEVATAQSEQLVLSTQEKFMQSGAGLKDLLQFSRENLVGQIEQIIVFADEETGLANDRLGYLKSQTDALDVMQHAAGRVVRVGQLAGELGQDTKERIETDAVLLLSSAQLGQAKLEKIAVGAAVLFVLSVALTVLWVARPMSRLTRNTERLASGDLDTEIGFEKDHSEIGRMANALRVFRDGLKESKAMESALDKERKAQVQQQEMIVTALADALRKLSNGDLRVRIEAEFPGEYAKLREDFNLAVQKLADVMRQIVLSSTTVKESSDEILAASNSLASRTERSAAALEESANSLNQLAESINDSASRADKALDVVEDARSSAESSKTIIQSTVSAMNQIAASSTEVRKINDMIDDIAFQTNLLALNAGVEAARAGEAGRGFAVVATEVRMLAQRATDAAQEIGTLLSESGVHIEGGVKLVGQTEMALNQINGFVEQVAGQVSEIAAATQGQAKGVSEINSAVGELDHDTQRNAAMFEETTASSVNLNSEANVLAEATAGFQVEKTDSTWSIDQTQTHDEEKSAA